LSTSQVATLELIHDAVVETGPDFVIRGWNRGAETIYGWTAEEAIGRPVAELVRGEYADGEREQLLRELSERGHVLTIVRQSTKAGGTVEVEAHVTSLRDASGTVTGYVSVTRDLSLRRRLEKRLEETHELELLARLAGGIAHDLNSLLTAILGYSELTAMDPSLPGHLRGDLEQVSSAARRAGVLTTQLVAFSRRQVLAPCDLDLDVIVADSLPARRRIGGRRVEFVDRPAPQPTLVHVDPRQLERALLDIVANAADAMPDGGCVTTSTAHTDGHACLTISDDGCGMDDEVRSRAFEPFFTTKPGHTGLGLSSVHGIVNQSGGRVEIASTAGGGTAVKMYLPLANA
jgi:PAS domain S-box-containing protein